jgi:CheY-like chemotaxis protein
LLIVEDYHPFRRFISSILQSDVACEIVGEAPDGLEAVRLAEELQPDLILLDVGLPGLNGIDVARQVQKVSPTSKILFLSQESSADVVQEALNVASGYVLKQHAHGDLPPAIKAVLRGERFISRSLAFQDAVIDRVPHQHDILFCSDDAIIVDSLAGFIATALNAGNPAIVWATEAHRESLLRRLRAEGVDIDAAIQRGIFVAADVSDPTDRARILETLWELNSAALRLGTKYPRIGACGERAGRLWAEGKTDEAIQLEQLWNELAKSQNIDILCPYPTPDGQKDATALERICAEHTRAYSLP